jgi:Alginate export
MRFLSSRVLPRRFRTTVVLGLALHLLAFVSGARPAWAETGPPPSEPQRPALQIGNAARFDEDWSVLRGVDLSKTDDFWDRVKFIPLTADGSVWLSIGGQVRERAEYFRHFMLGSSQPEDTDAYLASRYRLSADLHVTRYFRMFAEGKSAFVLDRDLQGGRTTSFVDEVDLLNGFADIMIPLGEHADVTLRGGRQELMFGAQRLVGVSDFTNADPRTFEGGRGIIRIEDWTISPFWAQLVVVDKYKFDKSTPDTKLFGIYSTGPLRFVPVNLDVYWLSADNTGAHFNGTPGRERRQTLGARTWGKIGETHLDFEIEGAGQFGTVGRGDIAAGMFTAVLGYTLPIPGLPARIYAEFDYASGDGKPGGDVGTFNQLQPSAHSYLGYMDFIGRQNIISPLAGVSVKPFRDLTLSLQQYFFWRASDRDAIYGTSGAVFRPGTGTRASYVGAEFDLLATYDFTRHLQVDAGYSHFWAGEFIRKTGPSRDSDFLYAAIQYTF